MRVASEREATSSEIAGSGRPVTIPNHLQVNCAPNDVLYPVTQVLVFVFNPFPSLVQVGNLNKNTFPFLGRIPGSTRLWGFISLPLRSSRFRIVLSFSNRFLHLISIGLSIQLFIVSPMLLGVIRRESPTTGSGHFPQRI